MKTSGIIIAVVAVLGIGGGIYLLTRNKAGTKKPAAAPKMSVSQEQNDVLAGGAGAPAGSSLAYTSTFPTGSTLPNGSVATQPTTLSLNDAPSATDLVGQMDAALAAGDMATYDAIAQELNTISGSPF